MASSAQTYIRVMEVISEITGKIAAWIFFATGVIVTFEVFMRYALNSPTIWVDEVSRIFQIWAAYLAIAYVLKTRRILSLILRFANPVLSAAKRLIPLRCQ